MKIVKIEPHDCIVRLAWRHGFAASTIWEHGENADLRDRSGQGATLEAGRSVRVPELRQHSVSAASDQKHRFRAKIPRGLLRLKIIRGGEPLANTEFKLRAGLFEAQGRTDGDGVLEAHVPLEVDEARLFIPADSAVGQPLAIGALQPLKTVAGFQARLRNLGYPCDVNGELDGRTEAALRRFQSDQGIEETGRIDDPTLDKMEQTYGA